MTDNLLFVLPADPEYFLPALGAVQCYIADNKDRQELYSKWYGKGKNPLYPPEYDYNLTLCSPNEQLDFLIGGVGSYNLVRSVQGLYSGDFSFSYTFDPELAYESGEATGKHVSQAFGMLIGADFPHTFPRLTGFEVDESGACSSILIWGDAIKPYRDAQQTLREPLIEFWDESMQAVPIELFTKIQSVDMVVGYRSFATYLAASLGKAVVEIYPTDIHRNWLSKWACKHYRMFYVDPATYDLSKVVTATEELWAQVHLEVVRESLTETVL